MAKEQNNTVTTEEGEEVEVSNEPINLVEIYSPVMSGEIFQWESAEIVAWRKATGEIMETLKALNKLFDESLGLHKKADASKFEGVNYFRKPREAKAPKDLLANLRK